MKTLIFLMSLVFILSVGCGDDTSDSSDNGNTGAEEDGTQFAEDEEEGQDGMEQEGTNIAEGEMPAEGDNMGSADGTGGLVEVPIPPTGTAREACAPFLNSCITPEECTAKYQNCLKPTAGQPERTIQVICSTQGANDITLTVNTWSGAPGKNQLLCDFIEVQGNTNIIHTFATNVKSTCENNMNARVRALEGAGRSCQRN